MRVLIVQPATNPHVWGGDAIFVLEPLGAEVLGAGLKADHDVGLLAKPTLKLLAALRRRGHRGPMRTLQGLTRRLQPRV